MTVCRTLLCLFLTGAPATAQDSPAAKPLADAWRTCALEKGRSFIRSGESAEVIAKVALYECRDQRQVFANGLYKSMSATAAVALIEQLESNMRDLLVSVIVQAKSK